MRRMVTVISDLHFEEECADVVTGDDPAKKVDLVRNIPSEAFEAMVVDVVGMARGNAVTEIVFVLAGDIFDLHRTQLWFARGGDALPFVDCDDVGDGSPLEEKLLHILDRIIAEDRVKASLEVFGRLQAGKYRTVPGDPKSVSDTGVACTLRYLPGNHDRLVNATLRLRRRVREILQFPESDAPFEHQFVFDDPPLLIRHGHEYDKFNFSRDLARGPIAEQLPAADYGKATFGDFVTVMIAARLPYCFRGKYGDAAIAGDPELSAVYCRLLQFDDVRPQSAVVDFFLRTQVPATVATFALAQVEDWQNRIWKLLEPVVRQLLDEAARSPFFRRQRRRLLPWWVNLLFALRPWRFGIPRFFLEVFAWAKRDAAGRPQLAALREQALRSGRVRFVAAGHTHEPQVAHLSTEGGVKTYFTDTGTWRNATLAAADRRSYGRVNATTYVAFYAAAAPADRRFEYWSGFDQSWPVDQYDR
jgi:UDP-2,3-diacylglucosamine pyrophosphatase LpxH